MTHPPHPDEYPGREPSDPAPESLEEARKMVRGVVLADRALVARALDDRDAKIADLLKQIAYWHHSVELNVIDREALDDRITELEAQVERLQEEYDEVLSWSEVYAEGRTKAEARIAELEAQLRKYGSHLFPHCPCTRGAPVKCQCGWTEIQKGLA